MLEEAISQRTMGARHLAHDCSTIADSIAADASDLEDDHDASLKPTILRGLEDIKQMLREGVDQHRSTEQQLLERCSGISVLQCRVDVIENILGASSDTLTNAQDTLKQAYEALTAEMSSTKKEMANLECAVKGLSISADQSSEALRAMGSQLSNCEKQCHKLEIYGASILESNNEMEKKMAGKEKDLVSAFEQLDALKSQTEDLCWGKLPAIEAGLRSELSTLRNEVASRQKSESDVEAIGERSGELEAFRRDIEERLCNLEVVSLHSELGTLRTDVEERLRDLEVVSASSEVDALRKDVESRLHILEERPPVSSSGICSSDEKTQRLEQDLAMVRAEMASLERQFLECHMTPVLPVVDTPRMKLGTSADKWEACKVVQSPVGDECGSDEQDSSTVSASADGTVSQHALEDLKQFVDNRHREHSFALTAASIKIGACEERCEALHSCRQSMVERLQGLEDDLSMVRARLASLERVREDGRMWQAELKMDITDIREVMDSNRRELADRHVAWSRDMEAALKMDVAAFKAATDATTKDVEQMHLDWSSSIEATMKQSIASVGQELQSFKVDVVDKQYDQSLNLAEVQKSVFGVQENINILRKMLEDWSVQCQLDIEDEVSQRHCTSPLVLEGNSLGALTAASEKINTVETFLRDCEKYCSELDVHCTGVVDRMQDIQLHLTAKGDHKIGSF